MDAGTEKMTFFEAIWTPSWTARSLRSLALAYSPIAAENVPYDHRQARSLRSLASQLNSMARMNEHDESIAPSRLAHSLAALVHSRRARFARPLHGTLISGTFPAAVMIVTDGWLAHSLRSFARALAAFGRSTPPPPPFQRSVEMNLK